MHIFCSEFLGEFENWYATVVNFLSNLKRECTLSVVNFWCNFSRVCALSVSNFWPNLKGVFTLSVLNSWSNLKRIFTLTVVNFCRLTAYTFTQFAVRSPSNERLIGRSNSRSVFIQLRHNMAVPLSLRQAPQFCGTECPHSPGHPERLRCSGQREKETRCINRIRCKTFVGRNT